MEMKELNVTNASEIQQLNSEEGNEDLDHLRIDLLRKRIQEQEKSGQKYLIFVVALPLIGVIALSILGGLHVFLVYFSWFLDHVIYLKLRRK